MNNNIDQLIEDEEIWVIFIVLSILNIYGDKLLERNIKYKENNNPKNLFIFTVKISLIIYIYLAIKNYNNYKEEETNLNKLRVFGSIFIIAGAIISLYYQINSNKANNPDIE